MGIYLNPGNDGFQISLSSDIYVDKTDLISITNARIGKENRFLCVSKPRRFGKSMTAGMLAAYYGKGCDSRALFQDCRIAQDDSFTGHINQYHVLFFEMQRFLARSGSAQQLVPYLEASLLKELRAFYPDRIDPQETHLAPALERVFLADKTGFVFIFDEWDCLFREEKGNKAAQKRYLDFLRDLLKGQTYVKLAYMTGILPIKKYGTHSALNMFDEYSMMKAGEMAPYMGFTDQEVRSLCTQYEMDFDALRQWYDGYHFPEADHVYSPKSIVDALQRKQLDSYWVTTETYEALRAYIEMNFDGLKDAVIRLLGATLRLDAEAVAKGLDLAHTEQTSILSYNNENSLSCVISLAYFSAKKHYTLIREFPSGKGFADIVFLPHKSSDKPALVVELKWDKSAAGALDQIRQKQYTSALKDYRGRLLLVAVNYDKKSKAHQCRIETAEKQAHI